MRVEGTGQFSDLPQKEKVGDKRRPSSPARPGAPKPAAFVDELRAAVEAEDGPGRVDWDQLIADVDNAGRELLVHQDEEHLKGYKKAVRAFVLAAVKKAYRVKVVEGRGPNPKLYVFVERVEGKLDELARSVLASHKNPLALLARIEELRGLLLDLKT